MTGDLPRIALLLTCLSMARGPGALAQNPEIYFPGKTNTNTNSVHNVIADLNRNSVLNFIRQPTLADAPQLSNPFQAAQELTSSGSSPSSQFQTGTDQRVLTQNQLQPQQQPNQQQLGFIQNNSQQPQLQPQPQQTNQQQQGFIQNNSQQQRPTVFQSNPPQTTSYQQFLNGQVPSSQVAPPPPPPRQPAPQPPQRQPATQPPRRPAPQPPRQPATQPPPLRQPALLQQAAPVTSFNTFASGQPSFSAAQPVYPTQPPTTTADPYEEPPQFTASQPEYPNAYVAFAFGLFTKSNPGAQNSVTSPILTQAGLALLQYGATGRTREDIGAVCGAPLEKLSPVVASLKSINSERTAVEYVSSLFVNNDAQVNRTFSAVAEQARTRVVPVNFRQPAQTVQIINSWVSQSTRAAIPSILDPNADTRTIEMLLVSAIYFKSAWKYEFESSEQGQFYRNRGATKPVTFIRTQQNFQTGYMPTGGKSGGAYWVNLPYAGDEFSMVIMVPQYRDTLVDLISELSANHVQAIINQLKGGPGRLLIDLKIPKFSIEKKSSLAIALQQMGLGRLFSSPSELVYVNEGRPVSVGDCVHSAKLSVDEKGTLAAAANAFSIIALSINSPDPEVPFIVDQPFLAMIVDRRNRYPLFVAKIFDP